MTFDVHKQKKMRNETLRSRNWWCVIVFCCCVSSFFRHHNLIVQFPNSVWFARFACRSTVCFCEIGWQGGGPNESTWLCTSVNTFYVKMMVQTDGLLLYDKYIMLEYIKEMASPKHSTRDDFRLRKPTFTHTQKERTSSEKIVFAFVFLRWHVHAHTHARSSNRWVLVAHQKKIVSLLLLSSSFKRPKCDTECHGWYQQQQQMMMMLLMMMMWSVTTQFDFFSAIKRGKLN